MIKGDILVNKTLENQGTNNAVEKCIYGGEDNTQNNYKLNLINSIIGNIMFQELRINQQMGYIAKNKIEIFDESIYFCLHVQGSTYSPIVMNQSIEDVLNKISTKIANISSVVYNNAKLMTYDYYLEKKLRLINESDNIVTPILNFSMKFFKYYDLQHIKDTLSQNDLLSYWLTIAGLNNKQDKKGKMKKNITKTFTQGIEKYFKISKDIKLNSRVEPNIQASLMNTLKTTVLVSYYIYIFYRYLARSIMIVNERITSEEPMIIIFIIFKLLN